MRLEMMLDKALQACPLDGDAYIHCQRQQRERRGRVDIAGSRNQAAMGRQRIRQAQGQLAHEVRGEDEQKQRADKNR